MTIKITSVPRKKTRFVRTSGEIKKNRYNETATISRDERTGSRGYRVRNNKPGAVIFRRLIIITKLVKKIR